MVAPMADSASDRDTSVKESIMLFHCAISFTANNIQGGQRDERINVYRFGGLLFGQDLDEDRRLPIECLHKLIEDLKVKGRRDRLPPSKPFLS